MNGHQGRQRREQFYYKILLAVSIHAIALAMVLTEV